MVPEDLLLPAAPQVDKPDRVDRPMGGQAEAPMARPSGRTAGAQPGVHRPVSGVEATIRLEEGHTVTLVKAEVRRNLAIPQHRDRVVVARRGDTPVESGEAVMIRLAVGRPATTDKVAVRRNLETVLDLPIFVKWAANNEVIIEDRQDKTRDEPLPEVGMVASSTTVEEI